MSIIVDELTKRFGSQTVVDSISFHAAEKGVIGFLGPNGAGKSTTMRMVTGYLSPDAGTIKVCGIPVHPDKVESKKRIGYLPEGNPLYYDMFVREYLSFIASVRRVANASERMDTVIEQTGLAAEANKKTGQLSKGYKQRVGLAAAMLDDPDVLILDEPTSGLDPNQIIEIRQLIRQLGETKTVLFSSHILQEVESICNRVIIINKGSIVADDSIGSLKAKLVSSTTVSVKLRPSPPAGWHHALTGVSHVTEVDGGFELVTSDADRVKKELLAYSIQNDMTIISLDSKGERLEDIFKTLTKQNEKEQ